MRNISLIGFLILIFFTSSFAQKKVVKVTSAEFDEKCQQEHGLYYALPKTYFQVNLSVVKTIVSKGEFKDYAYLVGVDKSKLPSAKVTYKIGKSSLDTIIRPDVTEVYKIISTKTSFIEVASALEYSSTGLLSSVDIAKDSKVADFVKTVLNQVADIIGHIIGFKGGSEDSKLLGDETDADKQHWLEYQKLLVKRIHLKRELDRIPPASFDAKYNEIITNEKAIAKKLKESYIKARLAAINLENLIIKRLNLVSSNAYRGNDEVLKRQLKELDAVIKKQAGKFTGTKTVKTENYSFVFDIDNAFTSIHLLKIVDGKGVRDLHSSLVPSEKEYKFSTTVTMPSTTISVEIDKAVSEISSIISTAEAVSPNSKKAGLRYRVPKLVNLNVKNGTEIIKTFTTAVPQLGIVRALPKNLKKLNIEFTPDGNIKKVKRAQL